LLLIPLFEIRGLEFGSHSLMVYVNDTVGNMGATENVNFTIEKPESFPTLPVATVAFAIVALVAAGLFVYHKKHKHNSVKKV
jgi:hypothetical protein